MRRLRSRSADDVDMVDVILDEDDAGGTVDVLLDQDASDREFLALLHELALEAIALRAHSPGDPHPEAEADHEQGRAADDESAAAWLLRRFGRRRLVGWAVVATAALAVVITPVVVDGRRAAARLAVLQTAPGVLVPATHPLVERWRLPGRVVSARADLLLVADARDGSVRQVDAGTGEATGAAVAPSEPDELREPVLSAGHTLPGGEVVTWTWDASGDSGQGSVTTQGGVRAFGLSGPPVLPALTDGSAAETLVVTTPGGDRLIGRSMTSGRHRWSRPYEGATPVHASVQVDGVMLLEEGNRVAAIDVRNGEERWSAPVASDVLRGSALVDGRIVLLPVRTGDNLVELVARRISDGTPLWRAEAPAGTTSLVVVDQHLVASTDESVVGLG